MKERFTRQLFYASILFYSIGTVVIFQQYQAQYPDLWDDTFYTNIWMFFFLFGTLFMVFTVLSTELKIKIKKKM